MLLVATPVAILVVIALVLHCWLLFAILLLLRISLLA